MTSPFITSADAAAYLLFVRPNGQPDLVRLHQFLARYRLTIRTVRRGRSVLIDRASLEAHLNRQQAVGNSHRRQRAFQPQAARLQQSPRFNHGAGVSGKAISDVHAAESATASAARPCNPVAGGVR